MDFQFDYTNGNSLVQASNNFDLHAHYQSPQYNPFQSISITERGQTAIDEPTSNYPRQANGILFSAKAHNFSDSAVSKLAELDPIEELTDLTYVLDPVGQILYASSAVKTLCEYDIEDVVGHNIMEFMHNDDVQGFVSAFNDAIMTQTTLFQYHRFRRRAGEFIILETNGHAVYSETDFTTDIDGSVVPACKCCILSARAYPTRPMTALDNFLELKLENERLKSELRDMGETDPIILSTTSEFVGSSTIDGSKTTNKLSNRNSDALGAKSDAPDAPRSISTPKNNSRNGMIRKEYESPTQPINILSSQYDVAHSTPRDQKSGNLPENQPQSNASGDSQTARTKSNNVEHSASKTLLNRSEQLHHDEAQMRKKSKKTKIEMERHVCSDCQTTDSPEWRKGPQGPKTLCNACGLRFSKKQKKTEQFHQMHNHHHNGGTTDRSETSTAHSSESGRERTLKSRSVSETQTPIEASVRQGLPTTHQSWNANTHAFQAFLKGRPDETFSIGLPYWPT